MKFSAHNILSIIALLPLLWSCSGGGDGDEPVPGPDRREPVCELTIRVGAVHSSSPEKAPSRAADLFNIASASPSRAIEGDFETPEFVYENIRTLRAIILRPDRSVEVNTKLQYSGNRDVESYVYLVKANEKKKIYIFVNEQATLTPLLNTYMAPVNGESAPIMPPNFLENIQLDGCKAGAAFINNTGKADGGGTWVPMSEFFDDIDTSVPDGQADAVYHKTVDLFVTRTPIKFSFNFSKGPGYNTEVPYVVEGIRISNMAGAEYYLPRNTVYNPDKYSPSTNPFEGRYITSFTSPAQAEPYQPYTFTPSPALEVGNTTLSYNPAIYLPESAASDYTVDIKVRDKNSTLPAQWLGAKPLPAPDNSNGGHIPAFLPRNTHVIVNITLDNPYNFSATVTVEPYKQVVLKPEFGFDPPEENNP